MPIPACIDALRPGQWVKNSLVFAGGFFALADRNQSVSAGHAAARGAAAFAVFCLVSGAVYLMNDVHDAEADALHPEKRRRPVASGRLPKRAALAEAALALALGFAAAPALGAGFAAAAAAYFALQVAYTFALKRVPLADAACIAAGFSLRVAAGAFAAGAAVYPWILACAFLLALFIALGKRRAELAELGPDEAPRHRAVLARYTVRGLDRACTAVAAAAVAAYAVWTVAPSTTAKFGTSGLAATVLPVAFGVVRYLRVVLRGEGGGRPEKTFLRTPALLAAVLVWLASCVAVWTLANR